MREIKTTGETELDDKLRYTVDIVSAFAMHNALSPGDLVELIRTVHDTLSTLGVAAPDSTIDKPKPATPINKSVQSEYIICLEDGKKLKMLKRYLRSTYDMSPDEYRKKWGLPADYPMVAPAYAAKRSEFAKQIGLGKGVRRKE